MQHSPNLLRKQREALAKLQRILATTNPRETYRTIPLTFLRTFHPSTLWPAKLRAVFDDIYTGRVTRAIMKGPRGGGKSFILAALGFCLWYFKNLNGVDMGGALEQAQGVYKYFTDYCYIDDERLDGIPKDPTITRTENDHGKYFKCVTASPKQVRGPHPDFLLGDEICEVKDELLLAALPMVDTSEDSLIVLTSTFHKIFGLFQETWDNADELGYTRYSWDMFDVVKPFDPAIWDDVDLNRYIPDFQELRALARGRTGDAEGWVPIKNVIQAWREKNSLDWFLVEYMGERPSAAGLVLNPQDVDNAIFDDRVDTTYSYVNGTECIIGIDWGFSSMTAVTLLMQHADAVKVMLENKNYSQTPSEEIFKDVIDLVRRYRVKAIYADSEAKFENVGLRNALAKSTALKEIKHNAPVIEVVFGKDKPDMLGNFRAHFERAKIKVPARFREAKWQYKCYQYQEGTDKPVKKDDHIPDSTMCALKHWPLGRGGSGFSKDMMESEQKTITGGLLSQKF